MGKLCIWLINNITQNMLVSTSPCYFNKKMNVMKTTLKVVFQTVMNIKVVRHKHQQTREYVSSFHFLFNLSASQAIVSIP